MLSPSAVAAAAAPPALPTMETTAVPLRPLSFREQLDMPFALVQADITRLAALGGAGWLAGGVVVFGACATVGDLTGGKKAVLIVTTLVTFVISAWIIRGVLRPLVVAIGLRRISGQPTGLRTAARSLTGRMGALALAQLWQSALTIVAIVLSCAVPLFGLCAAGWIQTNWSLTTPILVWEGMRTTGSAAGAGCTARERSAYLLVPLHWSRVGLWLVQRVIGGILLLPAAGTVLALSDITGTHAAAAVLLSCAVGLLLTIFWEIVSAASSVVSYLDARCRREGLDI